MKELFKSAVHIILTKDNKILLQKRKGSKLWPGYYALPAGHIDSGENQYDALVREAKEELDILLDPKNILKEYCNNSGNAELENAITKLGEGASGSGTKSKNIPRRGTTQATIDSLADLKEVCDRIIAG